jgi:hypothetical protein
MRNGHRTLHLSVLRPDGQCRTPRRKEILHVSIVTHTTLFIPDSDIPDVTISFCFAYRPIRDPGATRSITKTLT